MRIFYGDNFLHVYLSVFFICLFVSSSRNRAITNNDKPPEDDGGIPTSAKIVRSIRNTMNDTQYVNIPIQAYIIPSVDAHQVSD